MKKRISTILVCIFFSLTAVSSLEETIVLGKDDAWSDIFLDNCFLREGREGFLDILLEDSEYEQLEGTDLLLHFNEKTELNDPVNYRTVANNVEITADVSRLGKGAGVFQHEKEGLVLEGSPHSLFYPGISWKDFSIEFWLYPATLEEGETILYWQGSRLQEGTIVHQELRVHIQNQKLSWRFDNFFLPPDSSPYRKEITGISLLIPRQWTHHLLRFDSSTGLLEYLLDGEPEGIEYVSKSGREDGTVYVPKLGNTPESYLILGSYYTGFMDEFRISSSFISNPSIHKLESKRGRFITRPVDLGYTNTKVNTIEITQSTPADSEVFYYYRAVNDILDISLNHAEWIPFRPPAGFGGEVKGKYIQILGELYPDGARIHSPSVSAMTIKFEPDLPPLPPAGLMGTGGNSSIELTWNPVPDEDIEGYLIYYGERPGEYFGRDALEGPSPINVGNSESFVLTGMENGKLYYISLVSYDNSNPPHYSDLGAEISVRPSSLGDR